MELHENRVKKRSCVEFWQSIPEWISKKMERFFYRLGIRIAQNPLQWLFGCLLIILICISGLSRFYQEKNPMKLWVPPNSDLVSDTEWLLSHYEEGIRFETLILTADNVLDKQILIKLNEITKQVISAQSSVGNISWSDVCLKVPSISSYVYRSKRQSSSSEDDFFDEDFSKISQTRFEPAVYANTKLYCETLKNLSMTCLMFSILDIWKFDNEMIKKDSMEEIITKINTIKVSPTVGHDMNFSELLGGVTLDDRGRIVAATAVKTELIVHVNFTNVNMDKAGNTAGTADWATEDVLEWESSFLESAMKLSNELQNEKRDNVSVALFYKADRSFGDITETSIFQDVDKLCIGSILMFLYVLMILSKFNWIELRFCLTATGLLCVGVAFILAVSVCSLIGIPYGPVHTALPFLLLGLGVDDLFVFYASWRLIHTHRSNLKKPLAEKIGLALSHAGPAITITSFTDVLAFIIGTFTILPSLQSFCIYAAMGVFITYLLQITLFISFFTLDVKRIEQKRNGMLPCISHESFVSKLSEPMNAYSWKCINALYSRVILTKPGKIVIIVITIAMMSVGIMGSLQLKQWFDSEWLVSKGSYLSQFLILKHEKFPHEGYEALVLIGDNVDYVSEFSKIISLTERLMNASYVKHTESSWPIDFAKFVSTYYNTDLKTTVVLDNDFHHYLSKFLVSRTGGKYQKHFVFNETFVCGKKAPRIITGIIYFTFKHLTSPQNWIEAMDDSKRIVSEAQLDGYITVWSKIFGSWLTDKVIAQEVLRNIILALICVMISTAILIVELQTCWWILLCVLLTLLNVCGFMYYWDLTIDLVSCIGLELGVGLSVDYAAHIAHAFLNAEAREDDENARTTRVLIAVKHIGAAVICGAGSTLLAISLLVFSKVYVFVVFFRIFFLVILFGLWHGLMLLPVLLSIIGPRSLRVIQQRQPLSEKIAERMTDDEN